MVREGDLPEVTWRTQGRDWGKAWGPKAEIPLALLPCFWPHFVPLDSWFGTPAQSRAGFQAGGDRGAICEPPLEGAADTRPRPGGAGWAELAEEKGAEGPHWGRRRGRDGDTQARGRLWEPLGRPLPAWGGKQGEDSLPTR